MDQQPEAQRYAPLRPDEDRLMQMLWSCCALPRPIVLSSALIEMPVTPMVLVVCESCGSVH